MSKVAVISDFRKQIPFQVNQFINECGYWVADENGVLETPQKPKNKIGILSPKEEKITQKLFGKITLTVGYMPRKFLAVLDVTPSENSGQPRSWTMSINHPDYLEEAKQLAEKLSSNFETFIDINLVYCESPFQARE